MQMRTQKSTQPMRLHNTIGSFLYRAAEFSSTHLKYSNTQLIFKSELAAYVTEQIYSFSAMFLFFPLLFYDSFPQKSK